MNGYGYKYSINAFYEYIHVHDYQNVIDFPYYFNIFQPECVVFEVAEYTFATQYFDYEEMKKVDYNPALSSLDEDMYAHINDENEDIDIEVGNTLTTIIWHTDQIYPYVWLALDNTYDMKKIEGGYQVTVETERYKTSKNSLEIYGSLV